MSRIDSTTPSAVRKTLVVFSQTFIPDPASVGQHMADVCFEMARRGYRVRVFTSARGFEDPTIRYSAHETLGGVEIRRLPLGSLGKKSMLLRVLGTAIFQLQCLIIGMSIPNIDAIFFSTSPPLIGGIVTLIRIVRRIPIAYWAMDLNPDQLIALGKIKPAGFVARLLDAVNRTTLRESSLVVALDRFMAARLLRREKLAGRLLVMPPWPHEEHLSPSDAAAPANPFRTRHGLDGKFVVMYSGNHSPANPLTTLLNAAVQLKDDDTIRFLFVGGGSGKREVEQTIAAHRLANAISLPYQPLSDLKYSLAAADVHVVSLGERMVGIIHPCKIYGAMAIGRPILYFGPEPSHITDLLAIHDMGERVAHGDVERAVATILKFQNLSQSEFRRLGNNGRAALRETLSQRRLCARFCDRLEEALLGEVEGKRKTR